MSLFSLFSTSVSDVSPGQTLPGTTHNPHTEPLPVRADPEAPQSPSLLHGLDLPKDLPELSFEDCRILAQEVRRMIIRTVSTTGGHLAPSLGVVELTIALLKLFNPTKDRIIWDVGHQAYPWKLLTGRADSFHTLRQLGGISGYPKVTESPCDAFGVGHASTSISAALGMAVARDLAGSDEHVVAVIGDGALGGGMAFEALNQAGGMGKKLIVILNDNKMSISPNVGALSLFLSRNLSQNWVMRVKYAVGRGLLRIPGIGAKLLDMVQRGEHSFKSFFTPGMLFEAFRFNYIGPVNGHDLAQLHQHIKMAKELDQPVLLHVCTRKGKGYAPAENDPERFHSAYSIEPESGLVKDKKERKADTPNKAPAYSKIMGEALCQLAARDNRIVAITAAMSGGTGTIQMQNKFPERFVDVGICEEHAVTFAAGLAMRGYKPVVAIYSSFFQRAYDQIIHDVCLQNLPVVLCVDKAGLVGEDGPTHHGSFDLSFLRCVPNLFIMAPRDGDELRHGLFTALSLGRPVALRYSRDSAPSVPRGEPFRMLEPGVGEILLQDAGENPSPLCVIAVGSRVMPALQAAQEVAKLSGQSPTVLDARWVKPLPEAQIRDLVQKHSLMLLVEENTKVGGFSAAVVEFLVDNQLMQGLKVQRVALPDAYSDSAPVEELRAIHGLDACSLTKTMLEMLASIKDFSAQDRC